jgi:hypothetical protein
MTGSLEIMMGWGKVYMPEKRNKSLYLEIALK